MKIESPAPAHQSGFALVMAVFLIVVLALLGTIMVLLSGVQHQTVSLAMLQTEGLYAAESGIEWGTWSAVDGGGACNTGGSPLSVNNFSVAVTCTATTHTESGTAYTVYILTAVAIYGTYGQPDYTSRTMKASVTAP